MTQELIVPLISSATALVVAIGGWIVASRLSEKEKQIQNLEQQLQKLEKQVSRLRQDCKARIAVEKVACKRLAELENRTAPAAMLDLRNRTFRETGLRPRIKPHEVQQ
jgi:predicted nuclease with TOPRIM domain